jgi:integrase
MHLSELPSGHWRVAVKYQGRRRTATSKSKGATGKQEARLLGHELELELGAEKRRPDEVTVSDLLDLHLLSVREQWSPTTWHDADSLAKRLPDAFRERLVQDVGGAVIAGLYRELVRYGWSAHRLRRVRLILSTAWATAISYGWATTNPTRDAKFPVKLPHRAITPPDSSTVDKILAATSGQFELFLRTAAVTGARRGELIALQWADLDLERDSGLCRIARSLVCTTDGFAERDTKTAVKGHRTIKLGAPLTRRLREHRDWQAADAADEKSANYRGNITPIWVFSSTSGAEPWRPDFTSRKFAKACEAAGVTGVRLHDLRHHLATDQLSKGRSLHAVSQRLGHSSTATTQRVYSHWLEEADDMADDIGGRYG